MTSYIISLTLLAASVAILRTLFRKNVSAKLVYAMWLAVVLRLCLPFDLILLDVPTPEHFLGDMLNTKLEETDAATEKAPTFVTPSTEQIGSITTGGIGENVLPETGGKPSVDVNTGALVSPVIPDAPPSVESRPIADNSVMEDLPSVSEPAYELPSLPETPEASVPARDSAVKLPIKQMAAVLWIVGSGVTLGVFCISWLVFKVKLLGSRRFYGTCGRTKVYVSDRITSPCAFGVIPRIYITPEAESSPHLSVILLHEKTHIAHFDHLWNMVRVAAVAAHWWNPVIWLCAVLSKRDAELACDEDVTKQLDPKERLEYAKLIVDMIPVKKNCAVSFAGGPIKERIMKLTKEHKNKIIIAVVALLLVACSLVIAFIGAKDDSTDIPATSDTATETPETTEDAETTEVPESSAEPDTEPVPVYGSFKVLEATEENISSFEALKEYDVSSSEYSFSLILVSEADVTDLNITRLTWNEELLVEGEEIMENIGEVKAGEAILLTTDSVEIIGYTGISYTKDGETVRYYPATSGKDGSAILVEIGREMLSVTVNEIPADQRHVGCWKSGGIGLTIYRVLDGEIAFYINQYKGFDYKAVAVLKDGEYVFGHEISPYTEYSDYYGNRDGSDISGRIIFGEKDVRIEAVGDFFGMNRINHVFENTGGSLGMSIGGYGLRYTEWIGNPEAVYSTLGSIENLFIEKGWLDYEKDDYRNISGYYGDPNGVMRWGTEISSHDFEYKTPYYTIVGNRGALSVAVKFSYDLDSDTCSILDVYYADRFGNLLEGDELLSVTKGKTGLDAVLDASDSSIIEYFDSKGRTEKLDGARFEGEENYTDSISPEKLAAMEAFAKENAEYPEVYPEFSKEDVSVYPKERLSARFDSEFIPYGGVFYRYNFYAEPTFLYPLVGYKAVREWYDKVVAPNRWGVAYGEMYTVSFVKYFEIPKEDFIKAQNEYREKILPVIQAYGADIDTERYEEIPADIIYTFDNTIIANYHWRLNEDDPAARPWVNPNHLAQAETDIRYKWITSFIGKDIDGCVEVLASNWYSIDKEKCKKIMAPLEGVYFDNYRVSEIEDDDPTAQDKLLLEFEVVKSNCDVYPVGRYKAEVSTGMMFNFYVHFIERPGITKQTVLDKYEYELGVADYLFETAYNITFPDDPYSDDWGWRCMSENLVIAYMNVNNTQYGEDVKFTKAELLELAKELYGVENYKIHEDAFTEKDGIYRVNGHGGVGMKLDIVGITDENGIFAVDMRYYTDIAEFGEAFVVRYTFERSESVYGLRLVKIEKIKDNGYDNWGYVV